jgi:hypothetical protein
VVFGYKRWLEQDYLLDRMTLGDLVKAYFTYPAIQAYLLLFAACAGMAVYFMEAPLPLLAAAVLCFLAYPLVEYLLHRFLLHGRWLYKSPKTAALWKRIHFDHHQNPNELSVLFGALHTTLPVIVLVTAPIGWLTAGLPGIPAGLAAGFVIICFYEYGHCIRRDCATCSGSSGCIWRITSTTRRATSASPAISGTTCSAPTTTSPATCRAAPRPAISDTATRSGSVTPGWRT